MFMQVLARGNIEVESQLRYVIRARKEQFARSARNNPIDKAGSGMLAYVCSQRAHAGRLQSKQRGQATNLYYIAACGINGVNQPSFTHAAGMDEPLLCPNAASLFTVGLLPIALLAVARAYP